jgi:nitrogen fixation NifU-like protein
MENDLRERIEEILRNPANLGELADADAVGTVGNAGCGEMLRMWIRFKDEHGRKVIDRATFQSFGCETAIAVASLATELIRGKTAEEALTLPTETLAGELGPLPPMKLHCAQLVEGALHSALDPHRAGEISPLAPTPAPATAPSLSDSFTQPAQAAGGRRIVFLEKKQS